eukprot:11399918-Prorocentrum_lima.AAC.1
MHAKCMRQPAQHYKVRACALPVMRAGAEHGTCASTQRASVKESSTTLSSCEAELMAAVTGVKLGLGVRQLLKGLLETVFGHAELM